VRNHPEYEEAKITKKSRSEKIVTLCQKSSFDMKVGLGLIFLMCVSLIFAAKTSRSKAKICRRQVYEDVMRTENPVCKVEAKNETKSKSLLNKNKVLTKSSKVKDHQKSAILAKTQERNSQNFL
jgi:hypothetical protein